MPQSLLVVPTDPNPAETAAALTPWLSTKPMGPRIPEALWLPAVEQASTHGVAKVARVLRLDCGGLKHRLMAEAEAAAPPPLGFEEMTLRQSPAGSGCTLTPSDALGRTLRIE